MKRVTNKKDHRVVIIPKRIYRLNYREPSLTLIRKVADVWNLKQEDILDITEFSYSYHVTIKASMEYIYDYSNVPKYKHYSRDYAKKYRAKNKEIEREENEKIREYKKKYFQEHKQELNEYYKNYYHNHKEKYKEINRQNYLKRKKLREGKMKQYCRYCTHCTYGDALYCEVKDKIMNEVQIKSGNECKSFVFNEIDVINPNHIYKPRIKKEERNEA